MCNITSTTFWTGRYSFYFTYRGQTNLCYKIDLQMFYFKIDEEDDTSLNEDQTNYEDKDECYSPLNINYGSYP